MGIYKANQNEVSVFKLAKIHYLTTCQLKASLKKNIRHTECAGIKDVSIKHSKKSQQTGSN